MTKRLDYNKVAPNGVKALGGVYGYVMQSGLPADLVELVYLRISQINNCAYCLDMHTRDLIKKGMKIETARNIAAMCRNFQIVEASMRPMLSRAVVTIDAAATVSA